MQHRFVCGPGLQDAPQVYTGADVEDTFQFAMHMGAERAGVHFRREADFDARGCILSGICVFICVFFSLLPGRPGGKAKR